MHYKDLVISPPDLNLLTKTSDSSFFQFVYLNYLMYCMMMVNQWLELSEVSQHKKCQNTGFLWLLDSRIRTEFPILSLHENIRDRWNPYSEIF